MTDGPVATHARFRSGLEHITSRTSTTESTSRDFRIEYELDGRDRHEDVEVMSEHYRGAYAASKARAGFTCYRGGRGGRAVLAVEHGVIARLFTSAPGGLTIYQFDPSHEFVCYYAHLDRYAEGLSEGDRVRRAK